MMSALARAVLESMKGVRSPYDFVRMRQTPE